MSTLSYYEQYRALSKRAASLEGVLQFTYSEMRDGYSKELMRVRGQMAEIEDSLKHYIPYDLPPRLHYKALEEREFLFYRCIKGFTLCATAELMGVSRDTVYRIRRRLTRRDGRTSTALDDFPY